MRNLKKWFEETLGLKTYGDSLLSTNAKRMINALSIALFIQLVVDTFVWTKVASYGLGALWYALPAGFAIGLTIYLFDRSVAVADLSQARLVWLPITGRLIIILVLAFISARPLQLALFEPDIEARIAADEAVLRGKLVDTAAEKEAKRYQDLLSKADDDTKTVIQTIRDERAPKRQALLATQEARRRALDQQVREARDRMALEMAGQSASRLRGYGRAAKAAEAQVAKAVEELKDFESTMTNELRQFDAVTETKIEAALAEVKNRKDSLQNQRRNTLSEVESASAAEISKKYGGEWYVSRGFLRRNQELGRLKAESETVRWASHACELVMITLSLLVFLIKLMGGQALKTYYSVWAQAMNNDPRAREEAKAMGYDQDGLDVMVKSPQIRSDLENIHRLRMEVCQSLDQFWKQAASLCNEEHRPLPSLPKAILHERIRQAFEKEVSENLRKLRSAEEKLRLKGFKPDPWPETLHHPEPKGREPWRLEDSKLKEMGWVDPEKKAAKVAVDEIEKLYVQITESCFDFEWRLRLRITKDPTQSLESIQNWAQETFMFEILPKLRQMAIYEVIIRQGELRVPERPSMMPSDHELRSMGAIHPATLVEMGWKDSARKSHDHESGSNGVGPRPIPVVASEH